MRIVWAAGWVEPGDKWIYSFINGTVHKYLKYQTQLDVFIFVLGKIDTLQTWKNFLIKISQIMNIIQQDMAAWKHQVKNLKLEGHCFLLQNLLLPPPTSI